MPQTTSVTAAEQELNDLKSRIESEVQARLSARRLYEWVDPSLGELVKSRYITEIATAISTLYVGYKLGEKIDEVGKALAYTITAIGNVANAIADVITKLGQIIDAINKLLEALSKKIDAALMQSHFNEIRSASNRILDITDRLTRLPPEMTDPFVKQALDELRAEESALYKGIIKYLNQSPDGPSPDAIIACSPSVALWAQSYTMIERYWPIQYRRGPWGTKSQGDIELIYNTFFDTTAANRSRVANELGTQFLAPESKSCRTFDYHRFRSSPIPYLNTYPTDNEFDMLFCRIQGNPFNIFSTCYHFYPKPGYIWRAISAENLSLFSDQKLVQSAIKHCDNIKPEIDKRNHYLAETADIEPQRQLCLDAFKKPSGW
jgi:hypothetical protein